MILYEQTLFFYKQHLFKQHEAQNREHFSNMQNAEAQFSVFSFKELYSTFKITAISDQNWWKLKHSISTQKDIDNYLQSRS